MTVTQNDQRQSKFSWVRRLMNRSGRHHNGATIPVSSSTQQQHQHQQQPASPSHSTNYSLQSTRQEQEQPAAPQNQLQGEAKYDNESTSSRSPPVGQAPETSANRVQILENDDRPSNSTQDNDSLFSSKTGSGTGHDFKRRSNSNFTVPSVSRTSITTISPSINSDTASTTNTIGTGLLQTGTIPPVVGGEGSNTPRTVIPGIDTASVITIASSSKHHGNRRGSFDTNASTRAIAPESLMQRDSFESIPMSKSISSWHRSIGGTASLNNELDGDGYESNSIRSQEMLSS